MAVEVAKESGLDSPQMGKENGAEVEHEKDPQAFNERGRTLLSAILEERPNYSHATSIAGILAQTGHIRG